MELIDYNPLYLLENKNLYKPLIIIQRIKWQNTTQRTAKPIKQVKG